MLHCCCFRIYFVLIEVPGILQRDLMELMVNQLRGVKQGSKGNKGQLNVPYVPDLVHFRRTQSWCVKG